MSDITLRNVTSVGGLNPYAGVVLCNSSNPCTGFYFDNVNIQEGRNQNYTLPFITSNVFGEQLNSSPIPSFNVYNI